MGKIVNKSKLVLCVCCVFILCFSYSTLAAAEDTTGSVSDTVLTENKCAIGINDFPWNVDGSTQITLRWWDDQNNGKLLVLGNGGFSSQNNNQQDSDDFYSNDKRTGWGISGFRYYWLKREKVGKLDNFYGIWGKGIGIYYNDNNEKSSTNNGDGSMDIQYYGISFRVPVGLEYFFLKSCPNLSCSLLIDIFGSWNHTDSKEIVSSTDSIYYATNITHYNGFSFGATPMFAINYYFK